MIEANRPYALEDTLSDLICDNRQLLMAISRFGIPLSLAGRPVSELGECAGVNPHTFLAVANLTSGMEYSVDGVDLASLVGYLKRAHAYFLDFFLPGIRRKLLDAIDFGADPDLASGVLRFFDDYVGEVRRHMGYENDNLFAYVDRLLAGERDAGYTVGIFAAHHDAVSHKLRRLKDVLMRYCPPGNADLLNSVLFDIINCEDDLECHCRVEDNILVPVVARVESSIVPTACSQPGKTVDSDSPEADIRLGRREREIIAAVAKGWSNKEIADRLCISVHTVATHRRNICAKLAIHSSAGLTVYAILNGLVDLKDIDL